MEDLGIEAKEIAVREVAKILSLPEHLESIASIKSDYHSRQQVGYLLFGPNSMGTLIFLINLRY